MANVSRVNVDGSNYDLKDRAARERADEVEIALNELLRSNYFTKEQVIKLLNRLSSTGDVNVYSIEEIDNLLKEKVDLVDYCLSEDLTVQLGENGTVGGYSTGDVIQSGTNLKQVINKLFAKSVPPIYRHPGISIENNGGNPSGNYEIGTSIALKLSASFHQNDAGALTQIRMFNPSNNSTIVGDTHSPLKYSSNFTLDGNKSFAASASYDSGAIKVDNLGEPCPEGHIEAGTVKSPNYTFTAYRQGYFYGVLDTDSSTPLTSSIIRNCTKKNGAYAKGDIPVIKASTVENCKRIFIACPAINTGVTKVVMPSAMNADCTANFIKQPTPISVEGAEGYEGIDYNVWVYEPAIITEDQTFLVTLG